MNKERWQEICSVLDDIMELSQTERDQALKGLDTTDPELAQDVREYLHQDTSSVDFLGDPLIKHRPLENTCLGNYRLISKLGQGGMGVIYLAHHEGDIHRRVAIKLLRPGFKSKAVLARFKNEQQILANLVHANIAQLYEVGSTEEGTPYFVMEYVEGVPIDAWCEEKNLDVKERLKLMAQICEAVQFAHDNLVIHRDLKPANILVTKDGIPKLLDFGISKIIDPDYQALTITAMDAHPMTPQYASPEQVRGEALTTSSDVYTLGVIIYQLLTGQRPYALTQESFSAITHAICHATPLAPSQAVKQDSHERQTGPTTPRKLAMQLHGDLDNIILKAMRKEAQRRYASASRLKEDLNNFLQGFPVTARKDTLSYRTTKLIQRHPLGAASFASLLILLILSFVLLFNQNRAARASEALAIKEKEHSEETVKFIIEAFKQGNRQSDTRKDITAIELVDKMAMRLESGGTMTPERRAVFLAALSEIYAEIGYIHHARSFSNQALKLVPEAGKRRSEVLRVVAILAKEPQRLAYLEEALKPSPEVLEETYPLLRIILAYSYKHHQRDEAAQEIIEDTLRIRKPYSIPTQVTILSDCVSFLNYTGQHERSIPLISEALALSRKHLDLYAPERLHALTIYAQTMTDTKKLEAAKEAYEEILKVRRETSNPSSFREATHLGQIARLAAFKGEFETARTYLDEAFEMLNLHGKGNVNLMTQLANTQVDLLFLYGEIEEAGSLLKELEGRLHLDPNSWALEHVYRNLARYHHQRRELDLALDYAYKSLGHNQKVVEDDNPKLVRNYAQLTELHTEAGNIVKAQAYWDKMQPIVCAVPGHPRTRKTELLQAKIYLAAGQYALAESHAQDVVYSMQANEVANYEYIYLHLALLGQGKTKEANIIYKKFMDSLDTFIIQQHRDRYLKEMEESRRQLLQPTADN